MKYWRQTGRRRGGTKLDILSPSLSVDPDKMSYACCGASP